MFFKRFKSFSNTQTSIYYALPRVVSIALYAPLNVVQGIYAKHYGIALTTIATVIFISRMFDAITDPLIGYASDRYKLKSGTRKPLIILGAAILASSSYFLYLPPDDVSFFYFTFWFFAFYLGLTLFEIPHLAWGGELARSAQEKIRIFNIRAATGFIGLAIFYSIPLLPFWESSEITPETLKFSALLCCGLMLPFLYICMKFVPAGTNFCETSPAPARAYAQHREKYWYKFPTKLSYLIKNKPLIIFLNAFIFAGIGLGMWYGTIFIFVDAYLGLGELFAEIYLLSFVVGAVTSLAWIVIAIRIGKKNAWILAMLLGVSSFAYSGFLTPENADYWTLLGLLTLNTLCIACLESLPQSILSDIIDYSTWKFRVYRGATHFSLYVFIYKSAFAIGGALGLAIAGWYGFAPSSPTNTDAGVKGITLVMTWIPALFFIISTFFIAILPINAHRHSIIMRRLNMIDARSDRNKKRKCGETHQNTIGCFNTLND